jgi:integrase
MPSFTGAKKGVLRRSTFRTATKWAKVAAQLGIPGLHFHDLRHTGNHLAAGTGAGLRDLMTRMGHDSPRAALIYQHRAAGADRAIADAIDAAVRAEEEREEPDEGDEAAGTLVPA